MTRSMGHASRLRRVHAHGSREAVSVLLALRDPRRIPSPGERVRGPGGIVARPIGDRGAMRGILRPRGGRPRAVADRQPGGDSRFGRPLSPAAGIPINPVWFLKPTRGSTALHGAVPEMLIAGEGRVSIWC